MYLWCCSGSFVSAMEWLEVGVLQIKPIAAIRGMCHSFSEVTCLGLCQACLDTCADKPPPGPFIRSPGHTG